MIIVAGMHRSGTSALARIINLLGADIASDLIPAGSGNELGHWESRAAQELHNGMLADAGSSVTSAMNFQDDWFAGRSARDFVDRVADLISTDYPSSKLFVLKDPRAALFIPVWLAAARKLSIEPRFVISFRHPSAVAASLELRQRKLDPYEALPIPQGIALWLRYVLAAERYTRGQVRSFVSFQGLLSDWRGELGRIGKQIGIAWPCWDNASTEIDRFIDSNHVTAKVDGGDLSGLSLISEKVYLALERAVDDPGQPSNVFDSVAAEIVASENVLGAHALSMERQVQGLRETLDQHARRHAEDVANTHREFEREIRERDRRLEEASTYAKSQEARADLLEQQVKELRAILGQHAENMANAHRAFEREIRERDSRLEEAITYAKSQEARADQLEASGATAPLALPHKP